ncbi:MAG TPA: DUF4384 domain-containing protein, partial [Polyangiaceae bacterium]
LMACGKEGLPQAAPPSPVLSSSASPTVPIASAILPSPKSVPPSAERAPPSALPPDQGASVPGTRGVMLGASSTNSAGVAARSDVAPSFSTFCQARDASGATRPIVSGDTLHSGDHFWLDLGAHEPLYVYVIYVAADGAASVLYPSAGDLLLTPEHPQRLPETQDFVLDTTTGLERLIVVASRDVLAHSASSLAELVSRVRATHRWPGDVKEAKTKDAAPRARAEPRRAPTASKPRSVSAAPAPSNASTPTAGSAEPYTGPTNTLEPRYAGIDTRGIVLSGSPRGHVDVVPDSEGVIALPLLIEHVP